MFCFSDTENIDEAAGGYRIEGVQNIEGNQLEDVAARDMEIAESHESEDGSEPSESRDRKSRKRTVNKKNWKIEVRKRKRQGGEEYEDRKGKIHRGRQIQGECRCKYKCTTNIGRNEREQIHKKFWSLSDSSKNHFYGKFVERHEKRRSRTLDAENNRVFSYYYYLGTKTDTKIRVCKDFFTKTLDISQRRIYYFFENVYDAQTCTARSPLKGKNTKSNIDENKKQQVREHILSFPQIEAHYCRKDSSKKYLEPDLSLAQMYRLYVESVDNPVKESLYRWIFNHEFNLEFFKPKKDRCDHCEAFKANSNPSENDKESFYIHKAEKEAVKNIRDVDRDTAKKALDISNTCFVAFDLENVFALPKAEVSNFFYKRKLNCYNLTAHSMFKGQAQVYCMVWHEMISGRAGNHLASAVYKLMKDIMAGNDDIKKFILWSDSCVPQNKNSIMTLALQTFLKDHPSVTGVVQRFSEPGHGVVQEVDAVHSKIERWLKPVEIFSPLSLVRLLVNKSNKSNTKINVIQMMPCDFFDFQTAAKTLNYTVVPYTKIKELSLDSTNIFELKYKTSFTKADISCNIIRVSPRKQHQPKNLSTPQLPNAKRIATKRVIPAEKKIDIQSMLKFMPQVDKAYYEALFSNSGA